MAVEFWIFKCVFWEIKIFKNAKILNTFRPLAFEDYTITSLKNVIEKFVLTYQIVSFSLHASTQEGEN